MEFPTINGDSWLKALTLARKRRLLRRETIKKFIMDNIKKSSNNWFKEPEYSNLLIINYHGWDRGNLQTSLLEPITREEFNRRVNLSTISWNADGARLREFTD